jgi:glucokinase
MEAPLALGFDVGGTKILAGTVDRAGGIVRQHEVPSPTDSCEAVVAALDEVAAELRDERVVAVGYGIPANLDRRTRVVLGSSNLPLVGLDLMAHSKGRFGSLPVGVENDANAAALAEWRLGAGRSTRDLVVLTLGTGVGGGLVIDGRLYQGWAELGHIVVQENGPPCACGGHGHLEALASGHAGDRAARELYGPEADAHTLIARARDGEPDACAALARIGESLGAAVGSLVNIFDPDAVVVGGGFGAAAGELLLEPAREVARREALSAAAERLQLVPAELGVEAGLVGAGLVAFDALDGLR